MALNREEENPSIRLEIIQNPNNANLAHDNWGSNFFQPQRELTPSGSGSRNPEVPAPEKKLTLFALRLAVLEKAASGLGTLGFIWATVVLIGGFAVTLIPKDFWLVTIILVIEGTRIFSRSHELEWQHHATTWSLSSVGQFSFRTFKAALHPLSAIRSITQNNSHISSKIHIPAPLDTAQRTWRPSEVPILPYAGWVFLSRNFSMIFNWLQLISAMACAVLSLMRLIQQDYGKTSGETRNRKAALDIFYALALAEGLTFLMEKAYWNWKINYCKLLEKVCKECMLGPKGMASVKRFFYDSYSKCIDGSVFDGLRMDLVSFGFDLLDSDSKDEQLIGANILLKFSTNEQFSNYTLRRIGCSTSVIERLIEMLNWKNPAEEEIRRLAAEIVSKLAGKKHSAIRVATIPGAMESISSLLYTGKIDYDFSSFNLLGLLILKKLAHDHDNCYKIGNARGIMPKIIDFTHCNENLLRNDYAPESQIKIVKRSLQLVKILVSTTGQTGKMLRKEISEIVFTVSNIRDILQYGESHIELQKLGIEVLTGLAMDEEARQRIGSTGGVIKLLLSIFFKPLLTEEQSSVSAEAGEALAMLALENRRNCDKILKEKDAIDKLIDSLSDPVLKVNSSRILVNLCAYSAPECDIRLLQTTAAVPTVLKAIMVENEKLLEVSIGLAKQIFRFLTPEEHVEKLEEVGINEHEFAKQLVEILKRYSYPEIKVPRIRRFTIELMIWLMKSRDNYIQLFRGLEADEMLKCVHETTSELESFNIFSGSVGLGHNNTTLSSLVDSALELMGER